MSTPPVPPPSPNEPESGGQPPAPRYGQNAPQYGQQTPPPPQFGQNAPQLGQPYGQSPYAQYPSEQPQATGSSGTPQLVDISFWLLIGAGLIFVISTLMGIAQLDDPALRSTFEQTIKNSGGGADISYDDIKGVIAGTLVVLAIIGAAIYALVAFFVRKGKNWARILGTVFAALSLLGLAQPLSLGTLGTLAGIAAIVLLYLPSAAPYFRKQQPFVNPYGQPGSPYGR